MKKQVLLITGASGLVGNGLVSKFLDQKEYDQIICLVHTKRSKFSSSEKLKIMNGDVTLPNIGLSGREYKKLTNQITAIIHCAASVKFSLPLDEALKINYQGTVNITTLAYACSKLEKYAIISTAYIAGRRTGKIKETELEHNKGFVNTYEQSKYNAEIYLQEKSNTLPLNIYRLSTIIGQSIDGKVLQFNGIHFALKLYYHSLAPFIPAYPQSQVDFVSIDYVVDSIFYIFNNKFTSGKTYHIVSGRKKSFTISDLIDETYKVFEEHNPDWKKKAIEKPMLVNLSTFELFSKSTKELKNPVFLQVIKSIETFAPQLLYPKEFDSANTDDVLRNTKIEALPLREYYGKVVKYCLKTNWGRNVNYGKH